MNIIMFVDRFYPYIGGVEKHTLKICTELVNRGNDVTVITRGNQDLILTEVYNGIKIIRINLYNHGTRVRIFISLIKYIKEILNADVIHFHDFSTFYYWYLPFRYLLPWKKTYVTFHGWEGSVPPKKNIIKIRKKVEKLTRGNICVGHFIEKWYGTQATEIIYGAAETVTDFKKKINNSILYLGRLEPDTGILMYIDALIHLKEDYNINFKFELCGDGSLKDEIINKLNNYKIEYSFNGFVEDPNDYLASAQICFTSGYLGIIEAMINRCLVVAVYDNELKEDYLKMIPCSGNIIIANEPTLLAKDIDKVLKNKHIYTQKTTKAGMWAEEQTWNRVVDKYFRLWNI